MQSVPIRSSADCITTLWLRGCLSQSRVSPVKTLVNVGAKERERKKGKCRRSDIGRRRHLRSFLAFFERISTGDKWREDERSTQQRSHGTSRDLTTLVVNEHTQHVPYENTANH